MTKTKNLNLQKKNNGTGFEPNIRDLIRLKLQISTDTPIL